MDLVEDLLKHGFGASNNGNTAQRYFQDPELSSEITEVDKELIRKCSIILKAMVSNKKINFLEFERYYQVTSELYVSLYAWYYMPVAVHKILMHCLQVISFCAEFESGLHFFPENQVFAIFLINFFFEKSQIMR